MRQDPSMAAAGCAGKHRFEDANLAKKVARQSSARHDYTATAYRCATCGGWHVGSQNRLNKKPKWKK